MVPEYKAPLEELVARFTQVVFWTQACACDIYLYQEALDAVRIMVLQLL